MRRLTPLVLAGAALLAFAATVSAQFVIYSGSTYATVFSPGAPDNATAALDNTTFTTAPSSLHVTFPAVGNFKTLGFDGGGATPDALILPGSIDLSTATLTFDYMVPSSETVRLFVFRLMVRNSSFSNIEWTRIPEFTAGAGFLLTADGNWHTYSITGLTPAAAFTTGIGDGSISTTTPQRILIAIQSGTNVGGNLFLDNVTITPEPGAAAILLGAATLASAALRRRRA